MALTDILLDLWPAGVAALGATAAFWYVRARWYVAVPPNRALVLFGRNSKRRPGDLRDRAGDVRVERPRVVVGGAAFVAPWDKGIGHLSLDPVSVDVTIRTMHALEASRASGWEVRLQIQARVSTDPGRLAAAAETLLDKSEPEVQAIVRQTVDGVVPSILARLRPSDGEPDWDRLGAEIQAAVAADLTHWGLAIRTLSVTELRRIAPIDPSVSPGGPRAGTPGGSAQRLGQLLDSFDTRMTLAERTLGILADELDRVSPRRTGSAEVPAMASVLDLSLGSGLAEGAGPSPALEPNLHESMGGEPSPRSRRSSRDEAEEGGRNPRSLSG